MSTEVKLLTLLNVSAIKRPRDLDVPGGFRSPASSSRAPSQAQSANGEEPPARKRRGVVFGGEIGPSGSTYGKKGKGKAKAVIIAASQVIGDDEEGATEGVLPRDDGYEGGVSDEDDETNDDTFNTHFGPETPFLSRISEVEEGDWTKHHETISGVGRVLELRPGDAPKIDGRARIVPSISAGLAKSSSPLVSNYLSHLGRYTDLYAHSLDGEADGSESKPWGPHREALRAATAAHMMNHILKVRRRVVRNNERLARASAAGEDIDPPRDQSFTRPKALLLLPTRALALRWLQIHVFPLAPQGAQIENLRPFLSSFSVPDDEDPLAQSAASSEFSPDHIENFRGNTDDNFRLGMKVTRKAWRIVMPPANEEKLLDCDILIASPLALKMAHEREKSTDYLSSIEILAADGLDVMAMQNWDHPSWVFRHLNEIPASPHGCDFSRVKPWYLDNQARFLRQTLLFARYDAPEFRTLFNSCENVAGKARSEAGQGLQGVLERVRPGVRQSFERIDTEHKGIGEDAALEELDARFDHFTKKTLPALLRSAVQRQHTLVVVPSYFDFVRVTSYLRKQGTLSFAAVSEYSSNAEISKARTLFFKGKKDFLFVTERFHFYRRYRLRGAKTIVWYSLPEHAQFYAEFLSTPFIPARGQKEEDVDVDPSEVSSRALFSRFDVLKLERVVGHTDARLMLSSNDTKFEFA